MLLPVGIALGSNLGDSETELDAADDFLRSLSADGAIRKSPRFRTEPVDCPPGSGPFLNAVTEIALDPDQLPPEDLLERLQRFERERGRPREHERNSPRAIDLDIIYYGSLVVQTPELTLPHPRAATRSFVLAPLAKLRPYLVLPAQIQNVTELLASLP